VSSATRNLLIIAVIVIVFIGLPTLHVDLTPTALGVGFGAFVVVYLLLGARKSQQIRQAQQKAAADPALRQLTVYVGGHDGSVYALAANDGSARWQTRLQGGLTSLAVPATPTVVDGVVYVGARDNCLHALDTGSGSIKWRCQTGGTILSRPMIADGVVYVGSDDHHLYAVDARNGSVLWRYETRGDVCAGPAVADGVVYIGSDDHCVYALSARDSAHLWSYKTGSQVSSSPVVVDGVVYVGSGGLGRYEGRASQPSLAEQGNVWALRAGDRKFLWRHYQGTLSAASTPAVANGVVFVSASGFTSSSYTCVYALAADGGKLLWKSQAGIGGEYGVSVVVGR
jgi:outer membrane protein assembly factor BamB